MSGLTLAVKIQVTVAVLALAQELRETVIPLTRGDAGPLITVTFLNAAGQPIALAATATTSTPKPRYKTGLEGATGVLNSGAMTIVGDGTAGQATYTLQTTDTATTGTLVFAPWLDYATGGPETPVDKIRFDVQRGVGE